MQTNYAVNQSIGVEGMDAGGHRRSVPRQLPWLPQVTTITIAAGAATDDFELTVTDDETAQSYALGTVTGDADESVLAAAIVAAIRAHGKINDLFSVVATQAVSGSDVILTLTARHANRSYTLAGSGGTGAVTIADTQEHGGSGLEFGRFVVRGSGDDEFAAPGASSVAGDIVGALFRTEANHLHSLENDSPSAVDLCERGKAYAIMQDGRMLVKVEEAVTPASTPYMRRALTSSAGRLGGFRESPAGSTQVATITAIANGGFYGIEFGYLGQKYTFAYPDVDGTTTTDAAIDGLETQAALVVPTGVTASSASATATMTLTAAAGTQFDYVRSLNDLSTTVSVAAADVDAIDVSSICAFETSADADGLAVLRVFVR